ncbi:MAG TPA: fumarylacetoacetate hydrolase family protein, partial [Puia sp.]|nr:fumarylacetoacetate hydrolase family protein [Puia sp.]
IYSSEITSWDSFINQPDLYNSVHSKISENKPLGNEDILDGLIIQAPIQSQEIWAAGVTYTRSRDARMEESKDAGGGSFYDMVYDAVRPELFFKATPYRCVGTGDKVRIRKDSTWNVPEPELTLVINSSGNIVGYTIGNDMSSRSIEGENPLYLPQAKSYDGSAAIGPCVYISPSPISPETKINMQIVRRGTTMYAEEIAIKKMKRGHTELVDFLFRECTFPFGCLLMTGTCLVPPNDFTLQSTDVIIIRIDHIGELKNTVA